MKNFRDDTNVKIVSMLKSKLTINDDGDNADIKKQLHNLFDANENLPEYEPHKFSSLDIQLNHTISAVINP